MNKRGIKYNLIRLFRLKSSAHQIALGIAVGLVPGWFPTFGVGGVFSVILAKLVRANLIAALISGASVTFLWPFMYFLNMKIGGHVTSLFKDTVPPPVDDVSFELDQAFSWQNIGTEFIVGAVVNSILFGVITYLVTYWLFKRYRNRVLHRLRNKNKEGKNENSRQKEEEL